MITIIIPLYNEEVLIDELLTRTCKTMQELGQPFEIICVDDGSNDSTLIKLKAMREHCKGLKIVVLSRNFGHQAAYTAGLNQAKGTFIAMLDGDLQDPPELLPRLFHSLTDNDADVVIGRRQGRNQKKKAFASMLFHRMFSNITELNEIEDAGNFCMMTRKVADAIRSMNEKQRYLPGLRAYAGFRKQYFNYERDERFAGKAKMSTLNLVKLATDAIFAFSDWPIKACFFLGLFGVVTGLLAIAHTLISKWLGWAPLGWSSTYLSIYFFGAVQLLFLGIIGGYVYRIYKEVQNRPNYFIREVIE